MAKAKSSSADYMSIYNSFKKNTVSALDKKYVSTGYAVIDKLISEGKGIPLGSYIEITSQSGIGKCVSGDTIVCINDKFQRIDKDINQDGFVERKGTILSNPLLNKNNTDKFSYQYREFVKEVITLNDVHGNSITSTLEHPLYVFKNEEEGHVWVKAKDIKTGDCILMSLSKKLIPAKQVFEAYLSGIALEAYTKNSNCRTFIDIPETIENEIDSVLSSLNYICLNNTTMDKVDLDNEVCYKKYYHEKINHVTKVYYDFYNTNITMSSEFYEPMTYDYLLNKIAGLYETSSMLQKNGASLFSSNRDNIIYIQKFLAMLGIVGHRSIISGGKYKYCLKLNKLSTIHLFEAIKDILILKKDEVESYLIQNKSFSTEEYNYCVVSEKKTIKDEQYVYDYTIPSTHQFIANGFVSHNTTMVLDIIKHILETGKRVVYIDVETGVSENLLEKMGLIEYCETGMLQLLPVSTFNDCGQILDAVIHDPDTSIAVIDSITALVADELTEEGKKISDGQIGIQARYTGNLLQRYRNKISNSEKTIIFINQMRTKIPMGYGVARDEAAGGNAQKFSMDIRLLMKKIEPVLNEDKTPIGYVNEIYAIKNRFGLPNVKYQIKLMFGKGLDDTKEYEQWLIDNGIVESKGAGSYVIQWNGKEIKVRGMQNYSDWVNANIDEIRCFVEKNGGLDGLQGVEEFSSDDEDSEFLET